MRSALDAVLRRFVACGTLDVAWPDGRRTRYGDGGAPSASVALKTWETVRALLFDPGLAAGETYMDGTLVPGGGDLHGLLDLLMRNMAEVARGPARFPGHPVAALRHHLSVLSKRVRQYNPADRARRNVRHHYDLDDGFYELFLDADRQYSCAYFPQGNETLDEAQAAKKRLIAAKLLLTRPGLSVLDIGCGWGGLAITLARDWGARVKGITLSDNQATLARARVAAAGLSEQQVAIATEDYRAVGGSFDRIVSVGMFEHVGIGHYGNFFAAIRRALAPDGVALLHAIGRGAGPSSTNPWLDRYIFPGGYCPALSEVLPAIERAGLSVTDIEIWRGHYAKTLEHWRARFAARRDAAAARFDERFCRMVEFYLSAAELSFRAQGFMVFQIQLARRPDAVPPTRAYIAEAERAGRLAAAVP